MVVSEVRSANDGMHTALVTMFRGDPTQIGGRILTSTKFLHTVPTYPYDIWVQDETSHRIPGTDHTPYDGGTTYRFSFLLMSGIHI